MSSKKSSPTSSSPWFYSKESMSLFADPQGTCVARFLSRLLAFALVLYPDSIQESQPRPAKIARGSSQQDVADLSTKRRLEVAISTFLRDVTTILSSSQSNAFTLFVYNLLEQISMATACMSQSLTFDPHLTTELLSKFPENVPKEIMPLLCDVSTKIGREKLADVLCFK